MTRTLAFVLLFFSCQPNTAEIRCGRSSCASNQRCDGALDVCVLDEAPALIIDEPRVNAVIAGTTLKVQGTVTDDSGPATVELSTDGKTWTAVHVNGRSFSTELSLDARDGVDLPLSVRAHDAHQQATRVDVPVRIDNVAPVVALTNLADGAVLNAAWFTLVGQVKGSATDGSGLAALTIDVGDGPMDVTSPFALPWTPRADDDGTPRTVHVMAIDEAGNRTDVEAAVTVDVVAPQVAFVSPASGDILGAAFFAAGGVVRGTMSPGARVTVDFGTQRVQASGTEWSTAYRAAALDFVPQTLAVIATDEAGNTTRVERTVVVDVVAPRLQFVGMSNGAKLNAAQFPQGNDVLVDWQMMDGDAQTDVRSAGAFAPKPLHVTTSPTDNPKAYSVALDAEDRAGNKASAQLGFSVDRVAPTVVWRSPADGFRNNLEGAAVNFSEPMLGGAAIVLVPAGGTGTWKDPSRYQVTDLAVDTVYVQSVGAVTDLYGNPAVPLAPWRFHTSPKLPASGAVLMNDVWKFEAAADADGVLSFFTTSATTPATYHWARVNPKTGLVEDNRTPWQNVSFSKVGVSASSTVNPDLTARRVSAAVTASATLVADRRVWTRFDDAVASSDLGPVGIVPTRALSGEGAGLGEVGLLKYVGGGASYARTGLSSDVASGMLPTALSTTSNRWEIIEASGSTLKRRSYFCAAALGGLPGVCGFSTLTQWTNVVNADTVSFAAGTACSAYAYDDSSTTRALRVEPYAEQCPNKSCPAGWSISYPQSSQLRVTAVTDDTFLLAERIGNEVHVHHMQLEATCSPNIYLNRLVRTVPAGSEFRAVSLNGRTALLYVDASGALRVEM